jgi:hypothetical protein
VSSIWTPSGEYEPKPETPSGADLPPEAEAVELSPEQYQEMMQARAELRAVPVADIIANHAVGLHQLALIHLLPDPGAEGETAEPRLAEAGLAIDAFGALVETLGERLAPHHEALREALTQLRLAFVELSAPK